MQNNNYTADYAVGWFTLALLNAGLAQSKKRSGLAWFFASLLIGPIATLLIVVMDPPETPPVATN
jgi:hypothetical protein